MPKAYGCHSLSQGTQGAATSFHSRVLMWVEQSPYGATGIGVQETMSSTEQVFGRAWASGGGAGKSAAEFWRDYSTKLTHEQRLAQVRFIARMMDDQFRVPGTKLRFGLDLVLGLFPGLGDVVTSAISLFIVHHAWQSGAPKSVLARMLGNVGVDFLIGSVPLFGDLADFAWKANRKNARLLEAHLNQSSGKWEVR
jgi:hypothetical protein